MPNKSQGDRQFEAAMARAPTAAKPPLKPARGKWGPLSDRPVAGPRAPQAPDMGPVAPRGRYAPSYKFGLTSREARFRKRFDDTKLEKVRPFFERKATGKGAYGTQCCCDCHAPAGGSYRGRGEYTKKPVGEAVAGWFGRKALGLIGIKR